MEKYSTILILSFLVILLTFAILKTVPAKPQEGVIPVVSNLEYPLKSIENPECQYNTPDLYVVEPKLFQKVQKSLKIVGQATGSFENNVVLALEQEETGKVLLQESLIVEPYYPCTFSKEWGTGTLDAGEVCF